MGPHLLHDFVARATGTTMADATLLQQQAPRRPRKPRTTVGWPGRRR